MALKADGTWEPENDSVADGVNKLTSQDSPLMQQARGMGMKTAQSRGLLNSTMAARAGEAAAISAATPIASQDAAQNASKNEQLISGKTQKDLASANAASASALARQQAEAAATLETSLQTIRGSQATDLQTLQGSQQSSLAAQNAATERELQVLRGDQTRGLQTQEAERALALARENNAAQAANQAAASAAAMVNSYNDAVAAITSNEKLDVVSRGNYLTSLNNSTQAGIELINQATGAQLRWGSMRPATPVGNDGTTISLPVAP